MKVTLEAIKKGIEKGEFVPYLQPKYSLVSNQIIGAEALVRWIHKGEVISPGEFIPLLEKNQCISLVDTVVWESIAKKLAEWIRNGEDLIPISVNVSREDFNEIDVAGEMDRLLVEYGIPPEYLELEITESLFIEENSGLHEIEEHVRKRGFKILIDDFGSGYSSLNMLKEINADIIKMDMKFLDFDEHNESRATGIIRSIIDMANNLGMGIIAEGVETREQLDVLKECGCEIVQGYYFYKPMSFEDFEVEYIKQRTQALENSTRERQFGEECLKEVFECLRTAKFEEGLSLAKRALASLRKEDDLALYCRAINIIGVLHSLVGNEMMAMEYYLDGLSESMKENYSTGISRFYNNIGSEYQDLGDHASAIKYFKMAIETGETRENQLDSDYTYRTFIVNLNLALAYISTLKHETAKEHIDKCKVMLSHPDCEEMACSLKIIEIMYWSNIDQNRALELFDQAMVEIFEVEDKSDIWNDLEHLFDLAVGFDRFHDMEKILLFMDEELTQIEDEVRSIDLFILAKEEWIRYYELIGEDMLAHQAQIEYAQLCRTYMKRQKNSRIEEMNTRIQMREREMEREHFRKQINQDELTRVGNRYKLETDYKRMIQLFGDGNQDFGIGILDIDYFKEINDTQGHLVGDDYLKQIAELLNSLVHEFGGVYRYGGDEFVLLIHDGNHNFMDNLGITIKKELEVLNLKNDASPYGVVTVSQGYVTTGISSDTNLWQLLSFADKNLYEVKRKGKNDYLIT